MDLNVNLLLDEKRPPFNKTIAIMQLSTLISTLHLQRHIALELRQN